jgi:glycosyltransferase involved in cell wall biosynthesis
MSRGSLQYTRGNRVLFHPGQPGCSVVSALLKQLEKTVWRRTKRRLESRLYAAKLRDALRRVLGDPNVRNTFDGRQTTFQALVTYVASVAWDCPLYQRPHHWLLQMCRRQCLSVYLSPQPRLDFALPYRKVVNWGFVSGVVGPEAFVDVHLPKVLVVCSHAPITFTVEDVKAYKAQGFQIVYEYLDEINEYLVTDPHALKLMLARHHQMTPSLVDLYVCTSQKQLTDVQTLFPTAKTQLSQNACSPKDFWLAPKAPPKDLAPVLALGRPCVLYSGALAKWIDLPLMLDTARRHPEWSFVILGAIVHDGITLDGAPDNVFFLGRKPYAELAEYFAYMQAAIIPFKPGPIAESTSPVKLFEYLAADLPVVAPDCMKELHNIPGVALTASTVEDFSRGIQDALHLKASLSDAPPVWQAFVQQNSWEARVDAFLSAVQSGRHVGR